MLCVNYIQKICKRSQSDCTADSVFALHRANPDLISRIAYGTPIPCRSDPRAQEPGISPEHLWCLAPHPTKRKKKKKML